MSTRSGTHYPQTYSDRVYPLDSRRGYPEPADYPYPREPNQCQMNYDAQTIRNTRFKAPTFDGDTDPKVYLDWEEEMDRYFDWVVVNERTQFELARFNLIRKASGYWRDVEKRIELRGEPPIATWKQMKRELRDRYLPLSYQWEFLEQRSKLRQGDETVAKYIRDFDRLARRCLVDEPERVTISRFRAGLQDDIRNELCRWEIHYLGYAYQIARDFEELLTSQSSIPVICEDMIHKPIENPESKSEPIEPEFKSESIESESTPAPQPESNIVSDDINDHKARMDLTDEYEVIIYEADPSLVDEYIEDEPYHEEVDCETESLDIMDNESSERTIGQIPIEPLDNCHAEACMDRVIELDEVMIAERNDVMITDRKDQNHMSIEYHQEARATLVDFIETFLDSCPEPSLSYLFSYNIDHSSWDVYPVLILVPVSFCSYVLKTLWHFLGDKSRVTATYLKLRDRVFHAT